MSSSVVDAVTEYVQRLAVKQHKGTAVLEPAEPSELKHSSGGTAAAQRSPTRREHGSRLATVGAELSLDDQSSVDEISLAAAAEPAEEFNAEPAAMPPEDRISVGKLAQATTENITAEPAAMPSKKPAAKAVAKPAGNKLSLAAGEKTAADLHAQCDSLIARARMMRDAGDGRYPGNAENTIGLAALPNRSKKSWDKARRKVRKKAAAVSVRGRDGLRMG